MKDDMTDMHASPVVPDIPFQGMPTKKKVASINIVRPEKKNRNIIIGVAYIALFFLLAGGGVYGYIWWSKNTPQALPAETGAALYEMIPKDALAVIDYSIESSDDRSAIAAVWGQEGQGASTGNPTPLLAIPDITHIYYILLPDNARPYLLVRKTEGTMQYITTQSDEQVLDQKGWYVLHSVDMSQYISALAISTLTDASPLVPSESASDYLIQYALSPVFASHAFNVIASPTVGPSRLGGMVFRVTSVSQDGTLRASAHIPSDAQGETVSTQTQELMALVPGDVTFSYAGLRFGDELMKWQDEGAKLDSAIIAQPSVRQFLDQLTAPYAIFERQGADGVRDIGVVIALPEELKKQIHTGDPSIEQSLPALIPLILGNTLGIQIAFNDGEYNGIALRYMNINGQTQALDYIVGDNFLLISSSREGIAALIDTAVGEKSGLSQSEEWGDITQKAAAVLEGRKFMIGNIKDPALRAVLPGALAASQIPLAVSSHQISTGTDIQAVLSLE